MSDERPKPVVVKVMLRRERFWNRRMLRYFRWDLINAGMYLVFSVTIVALDLAVWPMLVTNVVVLGLLGMIIWRATNSYRQGYQDGLAAYPLAITQPEPGATVYLLEHSDELWKPSPDEVAHSMEIMRLEQEANGGLSGS